MIGTSRMARQMQRKGSDKILKNQTSKNQTTMVQTKALKIFSENKKLNETNYVICFNSLNIKLILNICKYLINYI